MSPGKCRELLRPHFWWQLRREWGRGLSPDSPGCPGRVGQGPGYHSNHSRAHTAADFSLGTFRKPVPGFFPAPSPPGPSGATIPLGRQMVTAARTQREGRATRRPPTYQGEQRRERRLAGRWPRGSDPGGGGSRAAPGGSATATAGVHVAGTGSPRQQERARGKRECPVPGSRRRAPVDSHGILGGALHGGYTGFTERETETQGG